MYNPEKLLIVGNSIRHVKIDMALNDQLPVIDAGL